MVVIRAAADISRHAGPNFIARGVLVMRQQSLRAHQLAGGAVTALRAVMLDEGFLERVELSIFRQPFHGENAASIHPNRELAAGVNRLSVYHHGASAALAAIAADFGAGELEMIAQEFHQRPAIFHFHTPFDAVDAELNGGARDGWIGLGGLDGRSRRALLTF